MRVRVLGAVGAFADGVEVALPVGRPRALLAMLALAGGKPVSAQNLVTGLWGEDAPPTAAKTLQVHMSTLRSKIRDADAGVELTPAGYRLVVDPREIDLVQFDEAAETGLAALADHRPDVASRALEQALALWTGDPLSNVLDAPFAAHESERLALRRLSVMQGKIDADLALGLGATLVDEVRQVADANPFNERACGHEMVALYRAGQPAAALEAFQRFRRTLGEELGLEPGPELVELERQILVHDDSLLVERRGPRRKRHNLPEQLSSFVGRERDVDHVRQIVSDARLTTLTGAGGSGKTRLALSVAAEMVDHFDAGAWFAELAALTLPEHVVTAVVQVLGARPAAGVAGLIEHVGEQPLLLLLDNCEHLIDAVAALAGSMLRQCPNLRVLATSREALGIEGEHVYRVPSLGLAPPDVKDAEAANKSAAVRLFVERAQLHRSDLALTDATARDVAQICRRLDGLPLAIELAASRVRTLSVDQLARRIDERFRLLAGSGREAHDRQHTLGALIDWSYDLLTGPERLMLERLSVFVGGFTMEAAENICSGPDANAFDLVAALGDKSLLEVDYNESGRLRMLETIRAYAAQRFASRDRAIVDATRLAHARYYLTMAEDASLSLVRGGPEQQERLCELTVEQENLRAAGETFLTQPGHADAGLRLANSLRLFWDSRGLFDEGAAMTSRFIDVAEAAEPTDDLVRAYCTVSEMLERRGDWGRAEHHATKATELARAAGKWDLELKAALCQSWLLARRGGAETALDMIDPFVTKDHQDPDPERLDHTRGSMLLYLNRLAESRAALEVAERAVRAVKNERRLAAVLMDLSCVDVAEGRLEPAARRLEEAQALAARLLDLSMQAWVGLNLGLVAIMAGDFDQAHVRYREALLLSWPGGELVVIQTAILGSALCCRDDDVLASVLHGFLDTAEETQGLAFDPTETRLREDDRALRRAALGDVEFDRAHLRGRMLSLADAVATARTVVPNSPLTRAAGPSDP